MIYSEIIIVGGGPAGSTCGWKLNQYGIECIILDKRKFPRSKLCAGWITPEVIRDLEIDINRYPHRFVTFNKFHIHIPGKYFKIKTKQHAIRRVEFDHWLLKRSGIPVYTHAIKNIRKDGDFYIIDDQYRCKYLVGAGGTFCPVYRTFFKLTAPRNKELRVVTLEEEFKYNYPDDNCHLWFSQNKLPGYSWYVPKGDGFLNIGIGGFSEKLKTQHDTIMRHWQAFVKQLGQLSLVENYHFNPKGSVYYIRDDLDKAQIGRIFIAGDAAGLATKDMGEGIGPAVKSGLLAATAIITGKPYSLNSIKKYSLHKYRFFIKLLNLI